MNPILLPDRDGAAEDPQTIPFGRPARSLPRPARVVPGFDESLGMRHQAEDPARRVADARDGVAEPLGLAG